MHESNKFFGLGCQNLWHLDDLVENFLVLHLVLLQNFVGLSVADGYIACGSETNEVLLPILYL